jgi:hypothetical protein
VAVWRRPTLTACGGPDHDHLVAQIVARLIELPRRAVVLADDEAHLNLLPHVRAIWTLRRTPVDPHPRHEPAGHRLRRDRGEHRGVVCRLGCRCAADFIALLDQLLRAFPAPR